MDVEILRHLADLEDFVLNVVFAQLVTVTTLRRTAMKAQMMKWARKAMAKALRTVLMSVSRGTLLCIAAVIIVVHLLCLEG